MKTKLQKTIAALLLIQFFQTSVQANDPETFANLAAQFSEMPLSPNVEDPSYRAGNRFFVFRLLEHLRDMSAYVNPNHRAYFYKDHAPYAPDARPQVEAAVFIYNHLVVEYDNWRYHQDFEDFQLPGGKPSTLQPPNSLEHLADMAEFLQRQFFFMHLHFRDVLDIFHKDKTQTEYFFMWKISEHQIRALKSLNVKGTKGSNLLELTTRQFTERITAVIAQLPELIQITEEALTNNTNYWDLEVFSQAHASLKQVWYEAAELTFELELLKRLLEPAVQYSAAISDRRIELNSIEDSESELRKMASALALAYKESTTLEEVRNENPQGARSRTEPQYIRFPTDLGELVPLVMEDSVHTMRLATSLHFNAPSRLKNSQTGRKKLFQMMRDGLFQQTLFAAGTVISATLEQERFGRGAMGRFANAIFGHKPLSLSDGPKVSSALALTSNGKLYQEGLTTNLANQESKPPTISNRNKRLAELEEKLWFVFFDAFEKELAGSVFSTTNSLSVSAQSESTPTHSIERQMTCEEHLSGL